MVRKRSLPGYRLPIDLHAIGDIQARKSHSHSLRKSWHPRACASCGGSRLQVGILIDQSRYEEREKCIAFGHAGEEDARLLTSRLAHIILPHVSHLSPLFAGISQSADPRPSTKTSPATCLLCCTCLVDQRLGEAAEVSKCRPDAISLLFCMCLCHSKLLFI